MQDDSLPGLDLEFLYYETPVGKVRRNKQFGREHIDILAKERHSKALVVVEVKKQGEDLDSALSQGLSYVEWLFKYRDTEFKNAGLGMTVLEQVKKLNCEMAAAYIDPGWIKDENISIIVSLSP